MKLFFLIIIASNLLYCTNPIDTNKVGTTEVNACIEKDSVVKNGSKRLIFHFIDCPCGGTIQVSTNKPIFGKNESARIMATDDVIGLDAVGYGMRLNNESDRRTCMVKYQYSRKAVTDTLLFIFNSY
jgi:hypothetical protein